MVEGVEWRVDHGRHNNVGLGVVWSDDIWSDFEEDDHPLFIVSWFNLRQDDNHSLLGFSTSGGPFLFSW